MSFAGPTTSLTFVLTADDPTAPQILRQWCYLQRLRIRARIEPESHREKVSAVEALADHMEWWLKENSHKSPSKPTRPLADPPVF